MKKTPFFLLLMLLLLTAMTASALVLLPEGLTDIESAAFEGDVHLTGRLTLPGSLRTVGDRAFAGTGLHALIVPEGCTVLSGSVLADTQAAYLYLKGDKTAITGSLSGAAYVFAPAFGSASGLEQFIAEETLVTHAGFYYSVTEGAALPLCAVDGTVISGTFTLPKLVEGQPIRSLDTLIMNGCDHLTGVRVPSYLEIPANLDATPYDAMSLTAPTASVQSANVGDAVTWTTEPEGAYGKVTYLWTFDLDGTVEHITSTVPTVTYTPEAEGQCTVAVSATDELGDSAEADGQTITVGASATVYRALLIGNTYPGTNLELYGSDNDVAGMRSMLSKMVGTPYRISTRSNLTAEGMVSAISNTFAGATMNDVSLFYFAGHGTNATATSFHGALMGTGNTYLTVARLKTVLDEIPGKKIVIVDSCHSGQLIGKGGEPAPVSTALLDAFNSKVVSAFATGTQSRGADDLANSSYYVITAAHSTEECITMGYDANKDGILEKHFGLFTYSLCYGSGWNMATNVTRALSADIDGDGALTLFEAYAYARAKAHDSNPNQTAQVYPDNSAMVLWSK